MGVRLRGGRGSLRRCARLVDRLDRTVGIPVPFDLGEFLDRWRRHRGGRPVTLFPLTAGELPPGICGLWLALPDRDVIGYPEGVPPNHRDHIVLHEVGHVLAGGAGDPSLTDAALTALLPDLDPAMVRSVLRRSVYDDVQEREAELVASLIMARSLGAGAPRGGRDGVVFERLRHTLDP
ncbi:hypothetical protein ACTMSW_13445 [Micromonospora sp. BQ11]|uniref:hypothetical protein n=1 Tax=Micromonospora sp. BQ11 TaxID=3452212 RepID=UPI003F889721